MNRFARVAVVLVISLSLSACAMKWKMATTPEYGQVKKIAIASFIVNNDIHPVGGGQSLTALASMVSKKASDKSSSGDGVKLVEFGLAEFAKELSLVGNWQIVPPDAVSASEEYKAFIADNPLPTGAAAILEIGLSVPPGMYNAYHIRNNSRPEVLKPFGELAKKLGADGVAIIRLDLGYQAHSAAFGMGTAVASVATEIKIINQEGKIVATTIEFGNNRAAVGYRLTSDHKAPLVAGELVYTGAVEGMFKDAITKNAVFIREQINKM